jgi:hypothetical protein
VFFRGGAFIFIFGIAPLALGVVALVDATRRPDDEWVRANQNKTLWVVLLAVGFLLCVVGVVLDLVYLLSIRPQLDRVAAGGGMGRPAYATPAPSGPQPGWYADPYARYELRYFDGLRWTDSVANGGVPGNDPAS